jgi:L-amino acid N-acyltransferase YncA
MNPATRSPACAPIDVRAAEHADAAIIARYNQAMAQETEALELDPAAVRRGVQAVIEDTSRGFYLVAEQEGRVCGALLVTAEWSDWRNARFWWVQSVYVVPGARRRGVYRAMHQEVRRRARAAGDVCGVRLYVEADNRGAQRAYARLGMHARSYRIFEEDLAHP